MLPIPPYNGPGERFSYLQSVIEELNSGLSRTCPRCDHGYKWCTYFAIYQLKSKLSPNLSFHLKGSDVAHSTIFYLPFHISISLDLCKLLLRHEKPMIRRKRSFTTFFIIMNESQLEYEYSANTSVHCFGCLTYSVLV